MFIAKADFNLRQAEQKGDFDNPHVVTLPTQLTELLPLFRRKYLRSHAQSKNVAPRGARA